MVYWVRKQSYFSSVICKSPLLPHMSLLSHWEDIFRSINISTIVRLCLLSAFPNLLKELESKFLTREIVGKPLNKTEV